VTSFSESTALTGKERHFIFQALDHVRKLILQMPTDREFSVDELLVITPDVTRKHAKIGRATILRDLKELQELDLVVKVGKKYKANTGILKAMMPSKKSKS
jgi:hypothetical protein